MVKDGKAGLQLVLAGLIFSKPNPYTEKRFRSIKADLIRIITQRKPVYVDGGLFRSKPVKIIESQSNPVKDGQTVQVGQNRSKTSPGGLSRPNRSVTTKSGQRRFQIIKAGW